MNHLRVKITPFQCDEDGLSIRLQWITTDESQNIIRDEAGHPIIAHVEEFRIAATKFGHGYVSEVGFESPGETFGAFFVDGDWARHFVVKADPGEIGMEGGGVLLSKRELQPAAG